MEDSRNHQKKRGLDRLEYLYYYGLQNSLLSWMQLQLLILRSRSAIAS
jgi:hypothetical protein